MKKKFALPAILLLSVVLLSGCAGAGNSSMANESNQKITQKIVKGQTTEAQVKQMFGQPSNVSYTSNGDLIWNFQYTHVHPTVSSFIPVVNLFTKNSEGHKKTLVVLFNGKGVVKNYSFSNSKTSTAVGFGR